MWVKRRDFNRDAGLAFLSGITVVLSACGGGGGGAYGSSSSPTSPGTAGVASGDESGQISSNHGHQAVITAAQLLAGGALQLDIRGSADHTHIVTLPALAVQEVKNGGAVQTDSTSTSSASYQDHMHTVTFNAEVPGQPDHY
jgi:hypothetical protein